jgi:short subunit dehydrogenase-like uncharacterized protein
MRAYDVVLFGATGFTGKLVAEYLAKAAKDAEWAIAGRNAEKLEAVKRELGLDVPVLIADANDDASLDALVPKARVVCTTVGPYAKYGKKLVAACTRHGTHYCDLTGEVQFIRWSIDENHAKADGARTRIVHCCGFDSIPFDLGVHMLFAHAKRPLAWAKSFAGAQKGGFSGGTIASMMNIMEEAAHDRSVRRVLAETHALDPEPKTKNGDSAADRDQRGIRFDRDIRRWTAPFLMAPINTRVVRRSGALLHYGDHFRYSESMSMPSGPKGLVLASAITAGMAAFVGAASVRTTRRVMQARLPKPGEGPSKESRERGYFKVRVLAETEDGVRLSARVEGHSDPGYGETSKMLGESALCLAKDDEALPDRFGVLTPASAMGMRLVERLRDAGMTFVVDSA